MKRSKQFLFYGVLIVGFIGLVAASPTIYAIVEPHITITMDPGQTTKPFVINDDAGTEVFSVDVDGTISPSKSFVYQQDAGNVITVPAINDFNNQLIIAQWGVDRVGNYDLDIPSDGEYVAGEIRRVSGTGILHVEFCNSADGGATWGFGFASIIGNSPTFFHDFEFDSGIVRFGDLDTNEIAVCAWNDDVTSVFEIQRLHMVSNTILPADVTVTEIFCNDGTCENP